MKRIRTALLATVLAFLFVAAGAVPAQAAVGACYTWSGRLGMSFQSWPHQDRWIQIRVRQIATREAWSGWTHAVLRYQRSSPYGGETTSSDRTFYGAHATYTMTALWDVGNPVARWTERCSVRVYL